ncbi:MAG: glycosyltransferase [Actinomycetota bacterium]
MSLLFVAGMHRSGTSFITEVIHAMGAFVGDDLLEPAEDNPHGFFEHRSLKLVNDRVLERLDGAWDRPPLGLTPDWPHSAGLDDLRQDGERFVSTLIDDGANAPASVAKDPRLSLTGRFWSQIARPRVSLVAVRDPVEVVQSLKHRNGMSSSRAASLWVRYTVDGLCELPNAQHVLLGELIDEPEHAVRSLADLAGLEPTESALELARSRRRTWKPSGPLTTTADGPDVELAQAIFDILRRTDRPDSILPALGAIARDWSSSPLVRIGTGILRSTSDLDRTVLDAAIERIDELERANEASRLGDTALRHERDEAKRDLKSASNRAERATADLTQTRTKLNEHAARLREESQLRSAAEARRDGVENDLHHARSKIAELEKQAREIDAETARLRNSAERAGFEKRQAHRRAERAEKNFDRLKSRRSVRTVLALTAPLRPVVRIARRAQRRTSTQRPAVAQRAADSDTPHRAHLGRRPTGLLASMGPERDWCAIVDRLLGAPPVTIVVPVYNAPVDVEATLKALIEWTSPLTDILVIDDASTDPRVSDVLESVSSIARVRLLHNDHNLGFTGTVNRGFSETAGDVVILNSDARVGPNWLVELRTAAYSDDRIASASAVSDNAGAFSMPETGTNPPSGLAESEHARLYLQRSSRRWTSAPTGHGFCMYLRREALDEVGAFDQELFPRGYGEENDWSMRAGERGWNHVVTESALVFHSNASSFDPSSKADLVTEARTKINARHPGYTAAVRSFLTGELNTVRQDAREIDAAARRLAGDHSDDADLSPRVRPRILSVAQSGRGGTPQTNRDLMTGLESDWDPWILDSNGGTVRLQHVVDGVPIVVDEIETGPLGSNRRSDPAYLDFVARAIIGLGIELVHVRHLFKHSQEDLPRVIDALGIPCALSFHDFYWICPNVNLVDETGTYCGGHCTTSPGDCQLPVPGVPLTSRLKNDWVHEWRRMTRDLFHSFDRFVTTSDTAREIMEEHFPDLVARGVHVIPHGRELVDTDPVAVPPDASSIRLAVIGNLSGPKGGNFLRELLTADVDKVLDVHVVGIADPEFDDLRCTFHGRYERSNLRSVLEPIRPAFGALLSIWPETWSHTLTESWSMGLPVLVSQHGGALAERVRRQPGGWIIDTDDPVGSLRRIVEISNDRAEWTKAARNSTVATHSSINQMADRYRSVYAEARRRTTPATPVVDVHVVTDDRGTSPGSAHVRTLRRFDHPDVRRLVVPRLVHERPTPSRAGTASVTWVQRTALEPDRVGGVIAGCRRTGSRLVVDLDDDLLDPEGLPRKFAQYVPTMRRLVGEADLVTVSTEPLAEVVEPWANRVVVLPNQLDERLWCHAGDRATDALRQPGSGHDVLYMGTETHEHDLELLREPLARVRHATGRPLRLHVVGGAPRRSDEWFDRIVVPDGSKQYPAFVDWLSSIAHRFDFAVAPLVDTPFTRSKSDLKFLEYTGLGLPTILSDVPAYRDTATHDVDALLADHRVDSWTTAIESMLDASTRRRLLHAAHVTTESRTIGRTADDFVQVLTDALES